MRPALLGPALAACLGLGAADLLALNLLARAGQPASAEPLAPASLVRGVVPDRQASALVSLAPALRVSGSLPPQTDKLAAPPVLVLEFGPSVHWLDGSALHALKGTLERLRGARQIRVVGHADLPGPSELNERLSAARAAAVARRLAHAGIERTRLQVAWSGARQPRADGASRRVEIYLEETP